MFCVHCGSELKEGARFCSACGAPVDADGVSSEAKPGDAAHAATGNVVEAASRPAAGEPKANRSAFAGQMEADRKRSRRKLSPLMIIALVLALLAGSALAAVLITQQANQGEEVVEQERPTATESPESSAAPAEPVFDRAKAEAEARAAAEAAGKTVLTGTVFIGTEEDWAAREGLSRAPNPGSSITFAGLVLDEPATVSAQHLGGQVVERSGPFVLLGSSSQADVMARWTPYEGQRVTVALSDIWAFSDSLGALFAFRGDGERIAPLTEADVVGAADAGGAAGSGTGAADSPGGNAAAATGVATGDRPLNGSRFISLDSSSSSAEGAGAAPNEGGDYVLADSSTRRYTRAELEALDVHTLFLARNEVFARHGCGFKSQELRDWFGSKPWYSETIPAGTYGADLLNDIETDNVNAMKAIEESRNSPYLS